MATFTFSSVKDAVRAIRRDTRARETRLRNAVRKAARESRNYIVRETVPRAFGELADSIFVEDEPRGHSKVIADAPHAAAVENGARPHHVPLQPLIAWVQLRGIQGLTKSGLVGWSRVRGEDKGAIRGVANMLRSRLGRSGAAAWRARAMLGPLAQRELGVDPATIAVARAIQQKIAKRGTRPRKYVQRAVEPARNFLAGFVALALPDR